MDRDCMAKMLEMMRHLQELEFAALELNLFLDTHPTDEIALRTMNSLIPRLAAAKRAYEAAHGPLINFGMSTTACIPWQWISEPWPWEY